MMTYRGIDVSSHNGLVDWDKVKASGVDFAMIRIGWTWYEGGMNIDKNFEYNIKSAIAAGLDVGVYVYSYDKSTAAAKIAAKRVLETIKPYKLTYPVVFDIEFEAFNTGAGKGKPNTDIVIAFLDEIEKAGYYGMLYCSTSFLLQYLQKDRLTKYDLWVADYREPTGKTCPYAGAKGMWQYTDKGKVSGCIGNVDLNVSYKNYPSIINEAGLNGLKQEVVVPKTISIDELQKQGYEAITL